jgi:hypothetical protein
VSAQCEMDTACPEPVTMIGDGGYIYCTHHGRVRRERRYERTRRMVSWELKLVESGQPLPAYTLGRKPVDS